MQNEGNGFEIIGESPDSENDDEISVVDEVTTIRMTLETMQRMAVFCKCNPRHNLPV